MILARPFGLVLSKRDFSIQPFQTNRLRLRNPDRVSTTHVFSPKENDIENTVFAFVASPLVAACADSRARHEPILKDPVIPALKADLAVCQTLASNQSQFDQKTIAASVLGAGAGVLLGEADDDGDDVGGAVFGALAGGTASAVDVCKRRVPGIFAYLWGRGHCVERFQRLHAILTGVARPALPTYFRISDHLRSDMSDVSAKGTV